MMEWKKVLEQALALEYNAPLVQNSTGRRFNVGAE
jgi:hypothetical protein